MKISITVEARVATDKSLHPVIDHITIDGERVVFGYPYMDGRGDVCYSLTGPTMRVVKPDHPAIITLKDPEEFQAKIDLINTLVNLYGE